jgi:hypothetical protein
MDNQKKTANLHRLLDPAQWSTSDLEAISKMVAAIALLMYACGFAVVTVYNGAHNIPETGLLKPKFAYTGFVFLLLTVVPAASTFPIIKILFKKETEKVFIATFILSYAWLSMVMNMGASFLFDFEGTSPTPHRKWISIPLLIVSIGVTALASIYSDTDKARKLKRRYFLYLLVIAYVLLIFYNGIPRDNEFTEVVPVVRTVFVLS